MGSLEGNIEMSSTIFILSNKITIAGRYQFQITLEFITQLCVIVKNFALSLKI